MGRQALSVFWILNLILLALLLSCDKESDSLDPDSQDQIVGFTLSSQSFTDGGVIPVKYTCQGDNTSPQLSWVNPPVGTYSYTVIVDDETSPCGPGAGACKHWQVFNIPNTITSFDEGVDVSSLSSKIDCGENYNGSRDWAGPCPPNKHTYSFTVYALDSAMIIMTPCSNYNRAQFEAAYSEYILESSTITCTFTP